MPAIETLHERLDREHTEALFDNYSADYETWLEERVQELGDENEQMLEFCTMLHETIEGGGRVVTFQDIDVEFLKALGGKSK